MLLIRRAIPAIIFFVSVLSFWLLLSFPAQFWISFVVAIIFYPTLLWFLLGPLPKMEKIHHLLLVLLFFLGSLLYVSFMSSGAWGYGAGIVASLLVAFFTENLFLYVWNPAAYEPYSIEYFSRVLQYGGLFLYSSFLFFLSIAGFSLFFIVIAGAISAAIAAYSFFTTQKFEQHISRPLTFLTLLLFGQIFAIISLFPFDPMVSALLLTIVFYLYTGLLRHRFRQMTSVARVQGYLIFSLASMALVMLTARWR